MMKVNLKVAANGKLEAASIHDFELMNELKVGSEVSASITKKRSSRENSFYWASLRQIINAGANFPTTKHLHDAIKLELGYIEKRKNINGGEYFIPDSTSFDKMDEIEFNSFMKKADELLIKHFGFGFDELKEGK